MMFAGDLPVNLGEQDILSAKARHRAEHGCQGGEIRVVGSRRLRGRDAQPGGQGADGAGAWCGKENGRVAGYSSSREVAVEPVIRDKPEKLVFDQRAANTEPRHLAPICGLEVDTSEDTRRSLDRYSGKLVRGAPSVITVIEVALAVDGIGS